MFPSKYAVSQKLFSSKSSRLIIHDWERSYYKPMVTELGYRVDREDREASRHTACLLPPANYTE